MASVCSPGRVRRPEGRAIGRHARRQAAGLHSSVWSACTVSCGSSSAPAAPPGHLRQAQARALVPPCDSRRASSSARQAHIP